MTSTRLLRRLLPCTVVALVLAGPGTETPHAQSSVLVATGATWKYLDNGSNQGTAWRAPGFNDSTWASGPAQLGYGDGDEATLVSFGPNGSAKYTTTYFRHAFSVANPTSYQSLALRVMRDDGVVVYLNGTEVFRSNLPTGTIAYNTLASAAIGGADESAFQQTTISPSLLVSRHQRPRGRDAPIRRHEHGHQLRTRAHRQHRPHPHARAVPAAGHAHQHGHSLAHECSCQQPRAVRAHVRDTGVVGL